MIIGEDYDPTRIPSILFKLAIVWNDCPSQRFGQLLSNLYSNVLRVSGNTIPTMPNLWNLRDEDLDALLDAEIQNIVDGGYDEGELLTDTTAAIMAFEEEMNGNSNT